MSQTVYFNGAYVPKDTVRVAPDDRGFLLGDGVYEVTRTYEGRLFLPDEHLERLRYSLREVRIDLPQVAELASVWRELLDRNQLGAGNAIVYIQVTRGAAPRTHAFPKPPVPPTVYAYAAPVAVKFDPKVGVAAITVPDQRWARCDIKSISLLANCIANTQAQEQGAFEAIFVRDGVALEGSHTSLFAVIDGEVRTAPRNNYVLPGITRGLVVDLCRAAGIPCRETPVFLPELRKAPELFLAGTTAEVLPIVQLDGVPVGGGTPGPVTRRIRDLYVERAVITGGQAVGR